jgi:hypothetical protein
MKEQRVQTVVVGLAWGHARERWRGSSTRAGRACFGVHAVRRGKIIEGRKMPMAEPIPGLPRQGCKRGDVYPHEEVT